MSLVLTEPPLLTLGSTWSDWYRGLHQAHLPDVQEDIRLARAKSLMDTMYAEALNLDTIAAYAWMSTYHFLRCFKKKYGMTPHQYLTQIRVQKAKWLLTHTEQSITEVCAAVGFESLGSFSTMFRRYVGHPPSHYRRKHWLIRSIPPPIWIPFCFMPTS